MKLKSLVIVNQHVTVKLYSDFVHTARHALEVDQIENEKNKLLVIYLLLLIWGR